MKLRPRNRLRAVECLESRIALSSTLILTDANGDHVKFTTSKGHLTGRIGGSLAPDGQHIVYNVDLSDSQFSGADFSVSVSKSKTGDGNAIIHLTAFGITLDHVNIHADLDQFGIGGLKTLTVDSVGLFGQRTTTRSSEIIGDVSSIVVKHDVSKQDVVVIGSIGSVRVGGSLIGTDNFTGRIFASEDIGTVMIGHDIRGGDGVYSGAVIAGRNIGSVTVGGSIYGGLGSNSGTISAADSTIGKVGRVRVGGSLIGGAGVLSGMIGGEGASGSAFADYVGTVRIGHDIIGGSGYGSGLVWAYLGTMDKVTVGGSVVGGFSTGSGGIESDGHAGSVQVGGGLLGGAYSATGTIYFGSTADSVHVHGSLIGGSGNSSAEIYSAGGITALSIGGDLRGGGGSSSGSVDVFGTGVTRHRIGGILIPGTGSSSGTFTG
jgi:hypothetical protein